MASVHEDSNRINLLINYLERIDNTVSLSILQNTDYIETLIKIQTLAREALESVE